MKTTLKTPAPSAEWHLRELYIRINFHLIEKGWNVVFEDRQVSTSSTYTEQRQALMKILTTPNEVSHMASPEKLKIVLNQAINVKFTHNLCTDIICVYFFACTLTGPWFGLNVEFVCVKTYVEDWIWIYVLKSYYVCMFNVWSLK